MALVFWNRGPRQGLASLLSFRTARELILCPRRLAVEQGGGFGLYASGRTLSFQESIFSYYG